MTYNKLFNELHADYPDIKWTFQRPTPDVIKQYGEGIVFSGHLENTSATFFVPSDEKDKKKWGDLIAAKLYNFPEEEK